MLMSKSRLEKFLYALYSLDSSDLPTPLSRIEELYKCLVTGEEAPTFKPISRTEKYLMAILGAYDVDSLPSPLSRVEVLLYKLATGDDNLDDVETFLSEHEELLAEIIRNGGVGGNIDIEYVLHTLSTEFNTLYNTAEKPVKSAILKGQTLVNIKGNQVTIGLVGRQVEYLVPTVKPNTRYLITYDLESTSGFVAIGFLKNISTWSNNLEEQGLKGQFILNSGDEPNYFRIAGLPNTVTTVKGLNIIEYQEGMENWDIPYFEGMKSVKMPVLRTTGKNLFDKEAFYNDWKSKVESYVYKEIVDNEEVLKVNNFFHLFEDNKGFRINVEKGVPLTLRMECKKAGTKNTNAIFTIRYGDNEYASFPACESDKWETKTTTFIPTRDYITICSGFNNDEYFYVKNIQIEEGSTATTYEPHKSNILTVNEEVELRGVGDVKDELNLITGELTQRIGEIVLDGSGFYINKRDETSITFVKDGNPTIAFMNRCINNRFSNLVYVNGTIHVNVNISEFADINEFKESMAQNNLIIQFHKKDESIKTVDLSVVNQDGNVTKLSTFDDITHITLSSKGLIPEGELEVATKNEEVLNTMSLEMDDIYTTQNALQETSDTQSENVDATMIATTEIYEELL